MKLYIFILLLLFSGSTFILHPQQKWKWEKMNYNFDENVTLISALSENNFWVRTNDGDLFHCLNGNVFSYETIIPSEYTRITVTAISNGKYIFTAMDNNWQTHFYHFENGIWRSDNFIFHLPVQEVAVINEGLYYAIGNFGAMLKYENKQWQEIETPLKSHINFIQVITPEEIYLGTHAEGIFLFDGISFRKTPFEEDNKWDIVSLKTYNRDHIYAYDSKSKIYKLIDGKFILENDENIKAIYTNTENISYFESVLKTDHTDFLKIQIPSGYRFSSYISYHPDSLLFTETGGIIYRAVISQTNYFTNLNRVYGIKSNDFTYNYIGAVHDFNNNGLPDIMTVNRGIKTSLTFFFNNKNSPFLTYSPLPFDEIEIAGQASAFFDYNNNGFIDFVINISDTGGNYLALYENDKKGNFFRKNIIYLPDDNILRSPATISPVDLNGDGKLDLCISYYYGPLDKTGYVLFLMNDFFDGLSEFDTTYKELTRGWNTQPIFADFTGNNLNDLFITNKWRNNKIFINNNGKFIEETESRFDSLYLTETVGAIAADFNNDGSLDIITISDKYFIQLFLNNGKGFFTDVSEDFGLKKISFKDSVYGYVSATSADFNNDGWLDLFIIDHSLINPKNILLINVDGKYFINKTDEMQITFPVLSNVIAADIDNDGDMDLFCYGYNDYALWINNLNDNNYIKIKPRGVISNSDGWGTKIWVYETGHLNDQKYLRGYRQIGSETFGATQNNEYIAHFGVDEKKLYDVKIKFFGGKEIILTKIKPGNFYYIDELTGFSAFMYKLPGVIYQTLVKKEIQYYLITTIFMFFILYSGTKIGLKKFLWDLKLSLGFVVVSISIYWLLIMLTNNSESIFLKYILPFSAAAAGIIIPNIVFLWISRNQNKMKSLENISDDLLHELMQFSHGAWALSNLNSLQLLYQHAPEKENDDKFNAAISERRLTFNEMVLPKLSLIINYSQSIGINNELILQLKRSIKLINEQKKMEDSPSYHLLTQSIRTIKDSLAHLKKIVYQSYSCDPVEVIKKTCESLKEIIEENNVDLQRNKFYEGTKKVLIKNYELADILDNCLQNSIKALAHNDKKEISINVYRIAPKICIDIIDSGIGIVEIEWDKIFESGYSKGSSTGQGLYYARETLKKYGGRIFVKSSSEALETIFSIELNEGILQ
jgi:signal transduction histidine kinase